VTASVLALPPLRRDVRVHTWVLARGVSDLGDSVWTIALAWTAVHVAGPGAAGLLLGIGTLPRAALVLVGGVLADRWDARRTVVVTNLARAGVQLGGILLLGAFPAHVFGVLAVVALLFGVADAVHNPAAGTMARQLVRPEDLQALMAVFQTVSRLARLGGAPLGGLLVAAFGVRAPMAVDAGSFALIGLVYLVWLQPRFPRGRSTGKTWGADLRDGLRYLRRTPPVRALLVAFAGLNLFVGPALAVGVALRVSGQHWGAHTLGLVEACVGAGAALGAIAAARRRCRQPGLVAFVILVLQGGGIVALGYGGRVFLAAAAAFIGVTAGAASTYLSALFQLTVEPSYLGRAQSVTGLTDDALMPAAMAGFGVLAGASSVTTACVVAGLGMALLCGWYAARVHRFFGPTARSGPVP
jgi:MFS family permease